LKAETRQEQETKAQSYAKKKQKLIEIMQKQQELVAANVAVNRERAAKLKVSYAFYFHVLGT
jgi:hypothetical protein